MIIKHDKSYCNSEDLVARGFAVEDIYSLRFGWVMTGEPINERDEAMHTIVDEISAIYRIYQYKGHRPAVYSRDGNGWDLFFWCNVRQVDGEYRRDYSYFTLTFNEFMSPEQRREILDGVMRYLGNKHCMDNPNLIVTVQYKHLLLQERMAEEVKKVLPSVVNQPAVYAGMEGKVIQTENGVFFKKKYARTRGYSLSNSDILRISWKLEKK